MSHEEKLRRIREVAMTVSEPRNAGEIAEQADVARNTAEKYLRQLIEADKLAVVKEGRERRYYPDPVTQYLDQVTDLIQNHSKEELTAELAAIRDDIDEWKAEYDVDSASELRASVGDESVATQERRQRMRDAEDWEYFEQRAELIEHAIQLYDSLESARQGRGTPVP